MTVRAILNTSHSLKTFCEVYTIPYKSLYIQNVGSKIICNTTYWGAMMRCPFCGFDDTKVIDSREIEDGRIVRRRRECPKCGRRFTTYERYESSPLQVIKRDGRRELFDKQKIINGMLKACEKRNISIEKIRETADKIESELINKHPEGEVKSKEIGRLVMKELKKLDPIAYIRFASVYKNFDDLNEFIKEIEKIGGRKNGK